MEELGVVDGIIRMQVFYPIEKTKCGCGDTVIINRAFDEGISINSAHELERTDFFCKKCARESKKEWNVPEYINWIDLFLDAQGVALAIFFFDGYRISIEGIPGDMVNETIKYAVELIEKKRKNLCIST